MSVIAQWHGSLEHRPRSLLSRVRALVLASGLDHALANGASPEASVLLAVHAQRIVCPRACRALAATVRRLTTGPLPRSTVPISSARIHSAAVNLHAIAARLDTNGPIAARGVAALRVLLSDGSGPLYRTNGDLRYRLIRILADLEPA